MKHKANQILVVDDELETGRLLQQRFKRKIRSGDLQFQFAQNGLEALQILKKSDEIDVALTDIRMPEMDGLTLLENLAKFENPLKAVVISAYGDMKNIRMAMNRGAFDFLTKPIDFEDLEITINKTLSFVEDLREQKRQLQDAVRRLHDLVFYDQLTGLPNKNSLLKQVRRCLKSNQDNEKDFALLMFEVERYSIIKSGFGHELSDRLIVEIARRLEQSASASMTPTRVGENIFAILYDSLSSLDDFKGQALEFLEFLDEPFQLDEITVSTALHTGAVLSNLPCTQAETFVQSADTALQISRQKNNSDLVFFDIQMQETAIQRLNLEVDLQKAIETQQLSLYYQPIIQLDTLKVVGFETLVRWQHPIRGQISPLDFISLAEETGLIVPLGELLLSVACQQLQRWKSQFGADLSVYISVNLSSLQLTSPNLLKCIDNNLKATGLSGSALRLEITESVLMENIKEASKLLIQLKDRDIQLSIDDFGTGYSSLSYLQLLPINTLKIDSTFVRNIENNEKDFKITSTIISLAKQLGLEVVAEGLEKEKHLEILRSLSCQYGQGFLLSKPLDVNKATAFISQPFS